ncbi:TPA: hypothetical protein QHU17_004056 [Enterobacter hormaechei subsp. xiangfangensis]|nr:hypothetical protein [Enterobacter hormaechei subsp. xiangfangensis]
MCDLIPQLSKSSIYSTKPVWGRDSDDYQAYRTIKAEWYQAEYGDNWWQLDAVNDLQNRA